MGLQSLIAAISTLRYPSEDQSTFLLGYSFPVFVVVVVLFLAAIIFFLVAINIRHEITYFSGIKEYFAALYSSDVASYAIVLLALLCIEFFLAIQLIGISAAANEAVFLKSALKRFGIPSIVIQLTLLELLFLLRIHFPKQFMRLFQPLKLAIFFFFSTVIYFVAVKAYAHWMWLTQFREMENYIFLLPIFLILWALFHQRYISKPWFEKIDKILLSIAIFLFSYTIFRQTAQWMDWYATPSKAYWHELANAFIQGRLYLINPGTTHDLTFYNGHWYVPNPPLPALILMPIVAIFGVENTNMVLFSIICGSLSVVLFYHLLENASSYGLINTKKSANLWLTALFAFGTCFWWLSIMGRMWFLSQIFTVFFITLSSLLVIRKASPWWVGLSLGLAILARPNVFTIWVFLLFVFIYYQQQELKKFQWKSTIIWSIQSAIPIIFCVAILLFYNYIRFNNFLDFGYVTITSAEWLTERVKTYGMFHPYFISSNFKMMFLTIPQWSIEHGCTIMHASRDGYSIWVMTPALFYLFRGFKKEWWNIGALISVIITTALLLLYHNNGAWQLGYRYFMDFIIPAFLLLASVINEKVSGFLKFLICLSILSNFLGILWWFNLWIC